ncbi:MAG: beta-lactamase family protein [Ectothiorhodospiraceae bacterium]|nr:beta-lactamase family protein [Ectothiorhodospiraceae bacterium]
MKAGLPGIDLAGRLSGLIRTYHVPGAVAAAYHRGDMAQAAAGVAHLGTGLPVTPDTLFQIGSITKLYTATLVMQLSDAGELNLDMPIRQYLPELRFADSLANAITPRHLLTHTAGLEGDVFADGGRGDDAIACYVRDLQALPLLHAPGELLSYCNSGFVVLGRLVERLTGRPFHQAFGAYLTQPAGLDRTLLLPEDVMLHRFAVGHLGPGGGEEQHVAPIWSLPQAMAPAGTMTCATAADVVRFARLHLADGVAVCGKRLLSPESARAMRTRQFSCPDVHTLGDAIGLGWFLETRGDRTVLAHDGGTIGQSAALRILPEEELIMVVLANGGDAAVMGRRLIDGLFQALADLPPRPAPRPWEQADAGDFAHYAGCYQRANLRLEFRFQRGHLLMDMTPDGPLAEWMPSRRGLALVPCGNGVFAPADSGTGEAVVFHGGGACAAPDWVFLGGRAHRRCGG